jgi:arginyl-tRNA synthetase
VIPGDLSAELSAAITALIAEGDLPASAAGASAAGTWRPAPGGDPAGYATSLPIVLSRATGQHPATIAGLLAARLDRVGWIAAAHPAAAGFLTITVSADALAAVAVRTEAAGPACARSDALAGTTVAAAALPALPADSWPAAWHAQRAGLTCRLAVAAGAVEEQEPSGRERMAPAGTPPATGAGSLRAAVAYSGEDAVRYLLARTTPAGRTALGGAADVSYLLTDPYYAVMLAHADAAAAGRWATALGLAGLAVPVRLAALLGLPQQRSLLGLLSWLPERVSSAGRGGRPHELPRYLERVAAAWLECRQSCPALPFGGRAAPDGPDGIAARLLLAAAARAVLAAGAGLIGIEARARI